MHPDLPSPLPLLLRAAGDSTVLGKGYTYFLCPRPPEPALIKIGWARVDVAARRVELEPPWPTGLVVLGILHGGKAAERTLHKTFETQQRLPPHLHRGRGGDTEWFAPSIELLQFIHQIPTQSAQSFDALFDLSQPGAPRMTRTEIAEMRTSYNAGCEADITLGEGQELLTVLLAALDAALTKEG